VEEVLRVRVGKLFLNGVTVLGGMTFWFRAAADSYHPNCCSQAWIESAPTAASRAARSELRTRRLEEARAFQKIQTDLAVASAAGALFCAFLYRHSKRRTGWEG